MLVDVASDLWGDEALRHMAPEVAAVEWLLRGIRSRLEECLVVHKDLIATILQRTASQQRVVRYTKVLGKIIEQLDLGLPITEEGLVVFAGLEGKIIVGTSSEAGKTFSDDTKSSVFIRSALQSAMKCPLCQGYLDTEKSMSYDHIQRARSGGTGVQTNLQLTHPYCNQSLKN